MVKKYLFSLLILTVALTAIAAGPTEDGSKEQLRVNQILSTAKEINATQVQVVAAITNGRTKDEFMADVLGKIRFVAPDKAPVGSPVQIIVEGVPEKAAEVWRRTPVTSDDVWLNLYDRQGKPVNIFWSGTGGTRVFDVIIAENGVEIPTIEIATHVLQYGDAPGPNPIPAPPTPSVELQAVVKPIISLFNNYIASNNIKPNTEAWSLVTGDLLNLTEFYSDFADIVKRDNATTIKTTLIFRNTYIDAGKMMFQETGMQGKYAGLAEIVDGILADQLGLDVAPLNVTKTVDTLNAVAWAFYSVGGK